MQRGRGGYRHPPKISNQAAKDRFLGNKLGGAVFGAARAMLNTSLVCSGRWLVAKFAVFVQALQLKLGKSAPLAWYSVYQPQTGIGYSMSGRGMHYKPTLQTLHNLANSIQAGLLS